MMKIERVSNNRWSVITPEGECFEFTTEGLIDWLRRQGFTPNDVMELTDGELSTRSVVIDDLLDFLNRLD